MVLVVAVLGRCYVGPAQVWGDQSASNIAYLNPLSVYLSPTTWFLYGAPCALNLNFTTTLKPALIMCNYTTTDTQCEEQAS